MTTREGSFCFCSNTKSDRLVMTARKIGDSRSARRRRALRWPPAANAVKAARAARTVVAGACGRLPPLDGYSRRGEAPVPCAADRRLYVVLGACGSICRSRPRTSATPTTRMSPRRRGGGSRRTSRSRLAARKVAALRNGVAYKDLTAYTTTSNDLALPPRSAVAAPAKGEPMAATMAAARASPLSLLPSTPVTRSG